MSDESRRRDDDFNPLPAVGVLLFVGTVCAALPVVVVAVASGEWIASSLVRAALGTLSIISDGHFDEPRDAYPAAVRAQMPSSAAWWTIATVAGGLAVALGVALFRRIEPQMARERLGRRSYDWRGSSPRQWARPRDVPELTRRRGTGFSLGTLDGRPLRADPEAHVAVVAPTRSGKTTRCVIPWLLEHDGPAIVTSTKRDVLEATREHRERLGRIWIFDPFSEDSASWNPLDGCEDWSTALRQATWLADATQEGDSEIASYWRGEAAKLLAPLLHAAALEGRGIDAVLEWVDDQDSKTATASLRAASASAAARQLHSVVGLDPRNRGTTFMSAGSVLAAYRFPAVLSHARAGVTSELLFDGTPQTLYVVASDRDQRLLAPVIVALLSSLFEALTRASLRGDPADPPVRVLLDEAANIAPLRNLASLLSQAAGHGMRFATVWQSLSQLDTRFGKGAQSIVANSTAKLFLGPVSDESTMRYLKGGLPESDRGRDSQIRAAALRQLSGDRALVISGSAAPALSKLQPYWVTGGWRSRGRRRFAT